MTVSLTKLILLLLIAFVLGVAAGWPLRGRRERTQGAGNAWKLQADASRLSSQLAAMRARCERCEAELAALREEQTAPAAPSEPTTATSLAPVAAAADTGHDDLKRIKGVGPTLERTLNEMGITRFAQIAAWSEADIAEVDERLRFHGRIQRDDWIGQATVLMRSG